MGKKLRRKLVAIKKLIEQSAEIVEQEQSCDTDLIDSLKQERIII